VTLARACMVLMLAACLPQKAATEIVITVDTTFGVPCTIDALSIEIAGPTNTVTENIPLTGAELPGSLTLVTDATESVVVTVTGMRAGEPFATASSEVAFRHRDSVEVRFILDRDCLAAPCPAAGIGTYTALPAPLPRRGCGATAYTLHQSFFEVRDACALGAAPILQGMVEMEAQLQPAAMPFAFRFYNAPVDTLFVGTNGYIGFTDTAPMALQANVNSARPLGEPDGFPVRGALPFWNSLRTGGGVCFATTGVFPDRLLWITWKKACFAASGVMACTSPADGVLTFSVGLEETTDRIYFGYEHMSGIGTTADGAKGQSATIGITSDAPKGCTADQCDADGTCAGTGLPCGYTQYSAQTQVDLTQTIEADPE